MTKYAQLVMGPAGCGKVETNSLIDNPIDRALMNVDAVELLLQHDDTAPASQPKISARD